MKAGWFLLPVVAMAPLLLWRGSEAQRPAPGAGAGARCSTSVSCAAGLACDTTTFGPIAGVCVETCATPCAPGQVADRTGGTCVCVAAAGPGRHCDAQTPCSAGQRCITFAADAFGAGRTPGGGVCVPSSALPCSDQSPCPQSTAIPRYCAATSTNPPHPGYCNAGPPGPLGKPCRFDERYQPASGTCVRLDPIGAACTLAFGKVVRSLRESCPFADGPPRTCEQILGRCTPGDVCTAGEVCDGLDNDCNGAVDDQILEGQPCDASASGECVRGTSRCRGAGGMACEPGVPKPESCDGKDNDCDGQIDDGIAATSCSAGVGECAATATMQCVNGVSQCRPGNAAAEVCDGKDNDCDGRIDDAIGPVCSGNTPRRCSGGTWVSAPACSVACQGGSCVDCVGTAKRCLGNAIQECRGGRWYQVSVCPQSNPICSDGTCVQCSFGETRCTDAPNAYDYCNRRHVWEERKCPDGQMCRDGACVTGSCFEGATRCVAWGATSKRQICVYGNWQDSPCPAGQYCAWDRCMPVQSCRERCGPGERCCPNGECVIKTMGCPF